MLLQKESPHICSFWVKGECKRGEEKPTYSEDSLADQNVKDWYCGIRNPKADKLLKKASAMHCLDLTKDKTLTMLYVGSVGNAFTKTGLRNHFYQLGEIWTITVVQRQQCVFIQLVSRQAVEAAAKKSFNKVIANGHRLSIKWARTQGVKVKEREKDGTTDSGSSSSLFQGCQELFFLLLVLILVLLILLFLLLLPPPLGAEEEASANYFNMPKQSSSSDEHCPIPSLSFGPYMFHPVGPTPPPFMRASEPIQWMGAHDATHSIPYHIITTLELCGRRSTLKSQHMNIGINTIFLPL